MPQQYDDNLILDYLEGEMNASQRAGFEALLQEDESLRRLVEAMAQDRAFLRNAPKVEAPPEVMDRVHQRLERQMLLDGTTPQIVQHAAERRFRLGRWIGYGALAATVAFSALVMYQTLAPTLTPTSTTAMEDEALAVSPSERFDDRLALKSPAKDDSLEQLAAKPRGDLTDFAKSRIAGDAKVAADLDLDGNDGIALKHGKAGEAAKQLGLMVAQANSPGYGEAKEADQTQLAMLDLAELERPEPQHIDDGQYAQLLEVDSLGRLALAQPTVSEGELNKLNRQIAAVESAPARSRRSLATLDESIMMEPSTSKAGRGVEQKKVNQTAPSDAPQLASGSGGVLGAAFATNGAAPKQAAQPIEVLDSALDNDFLAYGVPVQLNIETDDIEQTTQVLNEWARNNRAQIVELTQDEPHPVNNKLALDLLAAEGPAELQNHLGELAKQQAGQEKTGARPDSPKPESPQLNTLKPKSAKSESPQPPTPTTSPQSAVAKSADNQSGARSQKAIEESQRQTLRQLEDGDGEWLDLQPAIENQTVFVLACQANQLPQLLTYLNEFGARESQQQQRANLAAAQSSRHNMQLNRYSVRFARQSQSAHRFFSIAPQSSFFKSEQSKKDEAAKEPMEQVGADLADEPAPSLLEGVNVGQLLEPQLPLASHAPLFDADRRIAVPVHIQQTPVER